MLSVRDVHIDDLLKLAVDKRASDLHLTVGLPPMVRIDGELQKTDFEICTDFDTQRLVYEILTDRDIEEYEETRELDFSYSVKGVSRFRVNVYRQRSSVGCATRAISDRIPTMEDMKLANADVLKSLSSKPRGLVLVTGPTGSGKSTTLATMINFLNLTTPKHILTIENPVEYIHPHKKCMINQRELGRDTLSYKNALRAVLREDPDVVLIGEMRDMDTIEATLMVAETGHLVFSTLHTNSASETINRIIDVFPPEQQEQVRMQLMGSLQGVVSQQLIPLSSGKGRCCACEILVANSAIRNYIREGKVNQIPGAIEMGKEEGMISMDETLANLISEDLITLEQAEMKCHNRQNLIDRCRAKGVRAS